MIPVTRRKVIENLALAVLQGGLTIEKTEVLLYSLTKEDLLYIADLVARSGRYYESRDVLDSSKTGISFTTQERKKFAQNTFTILLEIGEGSAFFALGDVPTVKNTKLFVEMLQSNRRTSQAILAHSIPYHIGKYFFKNASATSKKMIYELALKKRFSSLTGSTEEMSSVGVELSFVESELKKGITSADEDFLISLVLDSSEKKTLVKYYTENDYTSLVNFCKFIHIDLPDVSNRVEKEEPKYYPDTTTKGISELLRYEEETGEKANVEDVKNTLKKISEYQCLSRTFEVGTLPHFHKDWFVELFHRYDSKKEAESVLQMFFRMRYPKYINMMIEEVMVDRVLTDEELEKLSLMLALKTK